MPFLFEQWRRFLVRATTIVCHGENSFTIGVPFARTDTDQDDWENVPESFCQAVLARQPMWTLSIRRHKAEEVLLGTTMFLSQTCRSWRPEVCLFDHESLQVVAYWGMVVWFFVFARKTGKRWTMDNFLQNMHSNMTTVDWCNILQDAGRAVS